MKSDSFSVDFNFFFIVPEERYNEFVVGIEGQSKLFDSSNVAFSLNKSLKDIYKKDKIPVVIVEQGLYYDYDVFSLLHMSLEIFPKGGIFMLCSEEWGEVEENDLNSIIEGSLYRDSWTVSGCTVNEVMNNCFNCIKNYGKENDSDIVIGQIVYF
jgi:hypothetical protein